MQVALVRNPFAVLVVEALTAKLDQLVDERTRNALVTCSESVNEHPLPRLTFGGIFFPPRPGPLGLAIRFALQRHRGNVMAALGAFLRTCD